MSNFITDNLRRLQEQYNAMEDFGPGPLFGVIFELNDNEQYAAASAVALVATEIHTMSDPFIVEGRTTNNQVFMEVMRRVFFFSDFDTLPPDEQKVYRASVADISTFLSDFGRRIIYSMAVGPEATNDGAY